MKVYFFLLRYNVKIEYKLQKKIKNPKFFRCLMVNSNSVVY